MDQERLGEIKLNNRGTPMKIIRYESNIDIDVMFLDNHNYVKTHCTYNNFNNGRIKNPFDKNVYDIGYIGIGNHAIKIGKEKTQPYRVWHELIARCYADKKKDKYPSYYDISTVCEEWKCYQRFADWYEIEAYECEGRLHLDKDILYPGNKIYSPYTCLLVPQRINMLFSNKHNKRGLPNGIGRTNTGYWAKYNQKELGVYETLEEAYNAYASEKEKAIKQVADEYKDIIPEKVYNALYAYKVDIRNDKNYITNLPIN